MAELFLTVCGVAAGLVGAVYIAVHFIRRSTKFLSKEEEEREVEFFRPRLHKTEDEEEMFL